MYVWFNRKGNEEDMSDVVLFEEVQGLSRRQTVLICKRLLLIEKRISQ